MATTVAPTAVPTTGSAAWHGGGVGSQQQIAPPMSNSKIYESYCCSFFNPAVYDDGWHLPSTSSPRIASVTMAADGPIDAAEMKTPELCGKVALLTGITGQDGSYLTELLISKVSCCAPRSALRCGKPHVVCHLRATLCTVSFVAHRLSTLAVLSTCTLIAMRRERVR